MAGSPHGRGVSLDGTPSGTHRDDRQRMHRPFSPSAITSSADRERRVSLSRGLPRWPRDPSETRRAELAARHDRIAMDMGSKNEGTVARGVVQPIVDAQLVASAAAAGL